MKANTALGILLLACITGMYSAQAANILFFFGFSGESHRFTVWPLVKGLADRGHKVTFFSPHEPKKPTNHPNIKEMVAKDIFAQTGMDFDPVKIRIHGGVRAMQAMWSGFSDFGVKLCEGVVTHKETMEWAKTASFDLVFINALFNDCGYGLAHKFKAPTILYSTTSLFPWFGEIYGIPEENYPEFQYHLPLKMTFLEEVWNTITPLYWSYQRQWHYLPRIEAVLRSSALNISDMPSLLEMDSRNSLVFYNSHFSEEFPRSLPPSVIGIGGMHVAEKTHPVPKDIQKFIDKWEDGFVYFSFGTHLKLPSLPQGHQDAIFQAIRKFPKIGFVMKWNGGEVPKNIPDNVLPAEWLSQQDILAHPKIRAFITHGGLLSIQESVYHGVPMIAFPTFAEQDYNAERIHGAGRGIRMEIADLTEEKMENAIREILTNKKYKENQMQVSRVFKDRPAKPVETAIWWTEYVLRHKDTSFLQPIGVKRTWYERRMLHIWGFIALVGTAALYVTFGLLRLFSSLVMGNKPGKIKVKKH